MPCLNRSNTRFKRYERNCRKERAGSRVGWSDVMLNLGMAPVAQKTVSIPSPQSHPQLRDKRREMNRTRRTTKKKETTKNEQSQGETGRHEATKRKQFQIKQSRNKEHNTPLNSTQPHWTACLQNIFRAHSGKDQNRFKSAFVAPRKISSNRVDAPGSFETMLQTDNFVHQK